MIGFDYWNKNYSHLSFVRSMLTVNNQKHMTQMGQSSNNYLIFPEITQLEKPGFSRVSEKILKKRGDG